jgi:enamine deaminase RidA (YjgF/YER057c/UK114 family)
MPETTPTRRRLLIGSVAGAAGIAGLAATGFAATANAETTTTRTPPEAPAQARREKHRRVKARLKELGLVLPEVAAPVGAYLPAVRDGSVVYSAGQLPLVDGNLPTTGRVGTGSDHVSQDDAAVLARTAALNALAAIGTAVDLDLVRRVVKVVGYVSSAPDFYGQSTVLNGASDLLGAVYGDAGKHARSVVGVAALPKNAPVEVEIVVSLR